MKLSEAILRGCEMVPRQSEMFLDFKDGKVFATCALGAAMMAVYGDTSWVHGGIHELIIETFPVLADDNLRLGIHRRNGWSNPDWSRERIADWLDEQGL